MTVKLGKWIAGTSIFTNKIEALVYASKNNLSVQYSFYDDVFSQVDINNLGKRSLKDLYKERALQLRDQYDYLVLYYSGGSDSWTILNTFLSNNIKLDCIFIRWPIQANKLHQTNASDKSAYNFMSEWELVLEKDIKWLSENHPEIKIEIQDWTNLCVPSYFTDSLFEKQQHMHSAASLMRMQTFSKIEQQLIDKGKTVGEIWGIDKPLFGKRGNSVGIGFEDSPISCGNPYTGNEEGLEFFYWTPNMPNLVFEQAYQIFLYLNENPQFRNLVSEKNNKVTNDMADFFTNHIVKRIIYEDWDHFKFQAGKPRSVWREDKDYWLYKTSEFKEAITKWRFIYNSELEYIDHRFCNLDQDSNKIGVKGLLTKFHLIGKFNK